MTVLTEYARAKVNLSLHVGAPKPNGRHDLKSLVSFSDETVSDVLQARPAANFSLAVDGPFAAASGPARTNLVLRAARAMNAAMGRDAPKLAFRLDKRLPCAAGIGGGSADAAAALRLVARAHGGETALAIARKVAPDIGGDVLACLVGLPGMMSGEGELYEPMLTIPHLPAILVNPLVPCPTGPVFSAYDQGDIPELTHTPPSGGRAREIDFTTYLDTQTRNDLQPVARHMVPQLSQLLDRLSRLETARLVRMSGSGATCFALFESMQAAETARDQLRAEHPEWWTIATLLGGQT